MNTISSNESEFGKLKSERRSLQNSYHCSQLDTYMYIHSTYTNHMCLMEEVSDEPVDLLLHMYIRSLQLSD